MKIKRAFEMDETTALFIGAVLMTLFFLCNLFIFVMGSQCEN